MCLADFVMNGKKSKGTVRVDEKCNEIGTLVSRSARRSG